MKKAQLTMTFPEKDQKYKNELVRMKNEESLNVSNFVLNCIKKEIGVL
tara:strand:+ start:446 stop:589 length:144 start_codon:yes stop_codon:yes gene_type:complete